MLGDRHLRRAGFDQGRGSGFRQTDSDAASAPLRQCPLARRRRHSCRRCGASNAARLDFLRLQRLDQIRRKRRRHRAIDDAQLGLDAVHGEFADEIGGAVLARQIKQRRGSTCARQSAAPDRARRLRPNSTSLKPAARAASALRSPTAKSGSLQSAAHAGLPAMASIALALVMTTPPHSPREIGIDRFDAHQGRDQHFMPALAQGAGRSFGVGLAGG